MSTLDPPKDPTDYIPLNFGAHKGKTPRQLLDSDPSYVVWLFESIGAGVCTRDLYLDACFILDEDTDRRYIEDRRPDEDDMRHDFS